MRLFLGHLVLAAVILGGSASARDVLYVISSHKNPDLLTLSLTTGAVASSTKITGEVWVTHNLACDLNDDLYAINMKAYTASDRLLRIKPDTGAATNVGSIGGTFLVTPVAINPTSGILYALGSNNLHVIDKNTGVMTYLFPITGMGSGTAGPIAVDSSGIGYIAEYDWPHGLFRLDLTTGAATHLGDLYVGTPRDMSFDSNDNLWLMTQAQGMYLIDVSTATATYQFATSSQYRGIAFKRGPTCSGAITSLGTGCSGTGGFTPLLTGTGCPQSGGTLGLELSGALGPSTCFLLFGLGQGTLPLGGGCTLNLSQLLPAVLVAPVNGPGPGQGTLTLSGVLPVLTSTVTFTVQAFTDDGGGAMHFANSNGVRFDMLP